MPEQSRRAQRILLPLLNCGTIVLLWQLAVTELGAETGIRAQRGRRAGQNAKEIRKLATGCKRSAENRHRTLWCGQVVVNLKPAH